MRETSTDPNISAMDRPKRSCNNLFPVKGRPKSYGKWLNPDNEMKDWLRDALQQQKNFAQRTQTQSAQQRTQAQGTDLLNRLLNFMTCFKSNEKKCLKFLVAVYEAELHPDFRNMIRKGVCTSGVMQKLGNHMLNKGCGPRKEAQSLMDSDSGIELLTDLAVALVIGCPSAEYSMTKLEQQEKLRNGPKLISNHCFDNDEKQSLRLVVERLQQINYDYLVPELTKAIVSKIIADKASNPFKAVPQEKQELALLALFSTFEKDGEDNSKIKPLSLRQMEELILALFHPYLQAKVSLDWINLWSEDDDVKKHFYEMAMGAINAFEAEQWPQYLQNQCSPSHRIMVEEIIDFTTKVVERVGYSVPYTQDKSTDHTFESLDMYQRGLVGYLWDEDTNLEDLDNLGGFKPKFPRVQVVRAVRPVASSSGTQQVQPAAVAADAASDTPKKTAAKSARQGAAGPSKKASSRLVQRKQDAAKKKLIFTKPSVSERAAADDGDVEPDNNEACSTAVSTHALGSFNLAPNVVHAIHNDCQGNGAATGRVTYIVSSTSYLSHAANPDPASAPLGQQPVSDVLQPAGLQQPQATQAQQNVPDSEDEAASPSTDDNVADKDVFPSLYSEAVYSDSDSAESPLGAHTICQIHAEVHQGAGAQNSDPSTLSSRTVEASNCQGGTAALDGAPTGAPTLAVSSLASEHSAPPPSKLRSRPSRAENTARTSRSSSSSSEESREKHTGSDSESSSDGVVFMPRSMVPAYLAELELKKRKREEKRRQQLSQVDSGSAVQSAPTQAASGAPSSSSLPRKRPRNDGVEADLEDEDEPSAKRKSEKLVEAQQADHSLSNKKGKIEASKNPVPNLEGTTSADPFIDVIIGGEKSGHEADPPLTGSNSPSSSETGSMAEPERTDPAMKTNQQQPEKEALAALGSKAVLGQEAQPAVPKKAAAEKADAALGTNASHDHGAEDDAATSSSSSTVHLVPEVPKKTQPVVMKPRAVEKEAQPALKSKVIEVQKEQAKPSKPSTREPCQSSAASVENNKQQPSVPHAVTEKADATVAGKGTAETSHPTVANLIDPPVLSVPKTVVATPRQQTVKVKQKAAGRVGNSSLPRRMEARTVAVAAAVSSNSNMAAESATRETDHEQENIQPALITRPRRSGILTEAERSYYHQYASMIITAEERRPNQDASQPEKGLWAWCKAKVRSVLGMITNKAHKPSPVTPPIAASEVVDPADDDGQISDDSSTAVQTLQYNSSTDDEGNVLAGQEDAEITAESSASSSEEEESSDGQDVSASEHSAPPAPRPRPSRAKTRRQPNAPRTPQSSSSSCEQPSKMHPWTASESSSDSFQSALSSASVQLSRKRPRSSSSSSDSDASSSSASRRLRLSESESDCESSSSSSGQTLPPRLKRFINLSSRPARPTQPASGAPSTRALPRKRHRDDGAEAELEHGEPSAKK